MTIDWTLTALTGGVLVALVLATLAAAGLVQVVRALRDARGEAHAAKQRHDEICVGMAELSAVNADLRRRLGEVAGAVERSGRLVLSPPPAVTGRAYELAARMAANGAAVGELVANCGLTPAEAELAVRVHGSSAQGRTAGTARKAG